MENPILIKRPFAINGERNIIPDTASAYVYSKVTTPSADDNPKVRGWYEQQYEYTPVLPIGDENPKQRGWYEKVDDVYVETDDAVVQTGKTYYTKNFLGYVPTEDETVVTGKSYFERTEAMSGAFSQALGFPSITSVPTINGGVPPSREDFNGAFYTLSSIVFFQQKGFIFGYDADQDYYSPALISDNNVIYYLKQDMPKGTVAPHNDIEHTYWEKFADVVASQMVIDYNDLINTPTKVSDFENDSNFQDDVQVDTSITEALAPIIEKIPNEASASNQLADKAFVNSTVQTNTANFRGNWVSWTAVPTDGELYPADYTGNTKPTQNDYMVLQDASGFPSTTLAGTWRFKYGGDWDTVGKSGWYPEYQVNETPMTAQQLAAINSGITAELVGQITTNKNDITLKANTADLGAVALSNDYNDLDNKYVLPVATNSVLGGVKQGDGVTIGADGKISIDTTDLVNAIDWTQLNTSEKLYNDGASGEISLDNGRVHITTATTIKMPTPPTNCATWVTLWCTSGSVTFDSTGAPVQYEGGVVPISTDQVAVYTLAGIGTGTWYCLFSGVFNRS